jgi:hypothetical protein
MDKTLEQEIMELFKTRGLKVMKITIKKKTMTTTQKKGLSQTTYFGMSWKVFAVEDE